MSSLPIQTVIPTESVPHDQPQPQPVAAGHWDAFVEKVQQRELLAPLLLLSAGYCALPFIIKQLLLLLTPVAGLLGFPVDERGRST